MEIYVKATKKVSIYNKPAIKVGDIAEVFAPFEVAAKIRELTVLQISDEKPQNILVSIIDVIKIIDTAFPKSTVHSVGEFETLVHFEKTQTPENKYFVWIRVAVVCAILIAGSSTAIMTFHTDTQIPIVFRNFYYIFMGETTESMALIDIPYSIGIAVGIIVFFNHFSRKKKLDDPTPIDVEMTVYEEEVLRTIADNLSKDKAVIGKITGDEK